MIEHPLALLAFLLAVIAAARALEAHVAAVQTVSSAVVCTLLGIALANAGVIPHASPVYEAVNAYAVPYAIVLVILASDLRDLRRAGGPMLAAFALAAGGSVLGGVLAGLAFAPRLGPETWKLSGQFAGSFVGGGMNFVAIGRSLQTDPTLFAAAAVVNNLSTVPWMLAQMAIYRGAARYYPAGESPPSAGRDPAAAFRDRWAHADMSVTDLAVLGALPLAVLWVSERLAPLAPGVPPVLWHTTLALALAQWPAITRLSGAAMLSYFALHLFFVVIGTAAILSALVGHGVLLVVYMAAIVAVHAAVVYGAGRLLRFDLATLTIASQAAVGGPGSALALAMSLRWPWLVTPGIIVGIFGYALGNYLGIACAYLVRALG